MKTTSNRPPRNMLGERSYPLIVVAHEKHDTRSWIVTSDDEASALGRQIFHDRLRDGYWYPKEAHLAEANDPALIWQFLRYTREAHEYERIEVVTPLEVSP